MRTLRDWHGHDPSSESAARNDRRLRSADRLCPHVRHRPMRPPVPLLHGRAHDLPAATQKTGWNQWVIDLTAFTGVNLTNVNTITIGIGTKGSPAAGGTGTMYFDDIRLIR